MAILSFTADSFLFIAGVALLFFIPGQIIIRAFGWKKIFDPLETVAIASGLSIVTIDGLMLLLNRLGIVFSRWSLLGSLIALSFVAEVVYRKRSGLTKIQPETEWKPNFVWTKKEILIIFLLIASTIGIKSTYLAQTILPTTTDLGHHVYWVQEIVNTGNVPIYEKKDIIEIENGYGVSQPNKIPDVIIGEHLPLAALAVITGLPLFSAYPTLVLFIVDLAAILAIFSLAAYAFRNLTFGKLAALFTLLIIGPLYAISPPQAKYVSGGVIGNLIGNLLIPLALYFFVRSIYENRPGFLAVSFFLASGMAYTHHLSSFLFLLIILASGICFVAANFGKIKSVLAPIFRLVIAPAPLAILTCFVLFMLFVYTPTYLELGAVKTVARAPTKVTREGLSYSQLANSIGVARMALGLIGIFFILAKRRLRLAADSVIFGWSIILILIVLVPQWLHIDIPTNRVATYISFPLSIMAGLGMAYLVSILFENRPTATLNRWTMFVFFAFVLMDGSIDTALSFKEKNNYRQALQTFHASNYLAQHSTGDQNIVKDHNYLTADSWVKLFFMQDYNYPFTRGYFKRYDDQVEKREPCTLWMISTPNSENARKCYAGTNTRYLMVNPAFDGAQFSKSTEFSRIYSAPQITIFYRHEN